MNNCSNFIKHFFFTLKGNLIRRMLSTAQLDHYKFETLKISNPHEFVFHVEFNRPEKRNAMNFAFFSDIKNCFQKLQFEPECRSIVVSGAGKIFTAGLDLTQLSQVIMGSSSEDGSDDVGRRGFRVKKTLEDFQDSLSAIEKCPKPVIACVHSGCVGGGLDLISACDIRYCSQDAWFSIREVDIGLAADIGTLQRLPKSVGNHSLVRELVFTGRDFNSDEAKGLGLVNRVFEDYNALIAGGLEIAKVIASKSPIAVQGSKINLNFSRDHSVEDGLKFISAWNMSNLQSEDLVKAAMAAMQKQKATFSKL